MQHQRVTARAYLSIAVLMLAAACGDDDDSVETNANTTFDGGVGASGGSTSGGRGGSTASPRGGTGGTRAAGGAGAAAVSGETAGAGANGGTQVAGADGAGTAGRGGGGGGVGGRSTTPSAGRSASTAGTNAGGSAGQAAATALSDAEIVSVLVAANEGEVQQNTVAVSKALAPSARDFAGDLVGMHQAAQVRLSTLLTTLNLTPVDNTVAQQLRAASVQLVTRLQEESTVTFDMTYLQSQIDVHSRVLQLIDDTLLPDASNSLLRSELVVVRGEVAAHLAQARALAVALSLDVDAGTIDVDAGP